MTSSCPPLDTSAATAIAALGDGLVVLDTNVLVEIISVDLLGKSDDYATPEELRRCPEFRCRQLRAKYSNLLGWHLARLGQPSLSLEDETTRILTTNIAPRDGGLADILTRVIIHHLLERVFGGWQKQVIRDDDFMPKGNSADRWLINLANHAGVPLITNEGLRPNGIHDRNSQGKKNIRARALEAGVLVYAPVQYLREQGVDTNRGAVAFVEAVTACLRSAIECGAIPGPGAPEAASRLVDVYRFVMLDEIDDQLAGIATPTVSWAL